MIISIFRNISDITLGIAILIAYLIVILSAIILHEVSHGAAAYYNGDMTAKNMGRLTLNPLKHLNPIGFIMMLFVGFGWANPVPIDPRNFRNYKKGMIQTSLAGVTMNLILAFLASICLAVFLKLTNGIVFTSRNFAYYAYGFGLYLFYYSMQINVLLMVFNLLPLYPLDGFRVVETLSEPDNAYVNFMYKYGNYVLIAFMVISYVLDRYSLFNMVQDLTTTIFNKLWLAIMGVGL